MRCDLFIMRPTPREKLPDISPIFKADLGLARDFALERRKIAAGHARRVANRGGALIVVRRGV